MKSLRSHEGYLLVDHSASPGFTESEAARVGLEFVIGQRAVETSTYTCSHCQTVVINNPKRTRERGYCKKCDHRVCDNCSAELFLTGVCYPFKARAVDYLEAVDKGNVSESLLLIP